MSSDTSSKIDKTKEVDKFEKETTISGIAASFKHPLVDSILLDKSSHSKCSKIGEANCYKNTLRNIMDKSFKTEITNSLVERKYQSNEEAENMWIFWMAKKQSSLPKGNFHITCSAYSS